MDWIIVLSIVAVAWSFLGVISGERQRRMQELQSNPPAPMALPPSAKLAPANSPAGKPAVR